MASAHYSFIDIAVLDEVRARFAAGEALAVLTFDLAEVLWANGPGAALFGYPDIEAAIGASPNLSLAARRQISATPGFPDIGRDRAIAVRMAGGLKSRIVNFQASTVRLPDGEKAVLLAVPAAHGRTGDTADRSRVAIDGFNEPGHFAAFVDAQGNVAAASNGFAALGIARETLLQLVEEVREEEDRLVKKLIAGAPRRLPAGFARLTDDPAMHFLVVVDEAEAETAGEAAAAFNGSAAPRQVADEEHAEPSEDGESAEVPSTGIEAPAHNKSAASGHDGWYFADGDEAARHEHEEASAKAARADRDAVSHPIQPDPELRMVRFAWRTDADSRFTAISEEFASAVGGPAADIIGRRFREVSNAFGLDPDGEITALLARRDTWSGRTVMWPVAGTDRKIPVDLAALPIYGRGRSFEGFRGFGIARAGEPVADPEAIGLALTPGVNPDEEQATAAGDAAAPLREESAEKAEDAAATEAEEPALEAADVPSANDKVIRLAEHRQPATESGLSATERSAFREIGERLRRESGGDGATSQQATAGTGQEAAGEAGHGGEREETADPAPAPSAVAGTEEPAATDIGEDRSEEAASAHPETSDEHSGAFSSAEESAVAGDEDTTAPAETGEASRAAPPAMGTDGKIAFLPSAFSGALREASRAGMDTAVLAYLPIPILIHAGDVLHYANREFFELTGYRDLDALGSGGGIGALFAAPYHHDMAEASDDRTMRLVTASGEEYPVEAHLRSVPWGDGKALLLAIRPIEEEEAPAAASMPRPEPASEEAAELELRLAEMRAIIDTATDGAVVINNEGNIRSMNRPAEALFGFDAKHVTGKPFTTLFAIESQRAVQDYLTGLSDHGVASVLNDGREVIGREAQGGFIPLFMTIGRLPGDSGYCAVLRDITQWKRAEEELTQARTQAEQASSQKTEFLARVSHEIRTPLNAIIGFSELMIDEKFGPIGNDRYRDYLRDINRSGNHVLDLVNDLLDISKIEAGEQEMHYEAVSLNEALAETVAMMQPQANRERVIIRSSFASRLPEVVADQRSVRQIALNLLSNAVRFTPAGGQVIVSTAYDPDGSVAVRVRDTGVGMSAAEVEEALKPFKQINTLKRKRGDGTGLGLPLTRALVEANRARFSIRSTPGKGTLVEITFPATRVLAD